MASVYNVIKGRLRMGGYGRRDAEAIIWIAKAAKSCELARRWWTMETHLLSAANIEVLWESVRHLAALYALTFLVDGSDPVGRG